MSLEAWNNDSKLPLAFCWGKKLSEKNCDWIIANDISKNDIGFDSDFNKVSIFYKNNFEENLPKMKKSNLANEIVNRIISQLN